MSAAMVPTMPRRMLPVCLLLLGLLGCGPSSGQIRAAREARYQGNQFELFDACLEVAKASYGIAGVDDMQADGHGAILTAGRWFGRNGEARPKVADTTGVVDGDVFLELLVVVQPAGSFFEVTVRPLAEQYVYGHPTTNHLEAGDPRMPGWVGGQIDDLQVQLHQRLAAFAIAPAP